MSRAVWSFETNAWTKAIGSGDADEMGAGPGSYDIDQSVWHVNVSSSPYLIYHACTRSDAFVVWQPHSERRVGLGCVPSYLGLDQLGDIRFRYLL